MGIALEPVALPVADRPCVPAFFDVAPENLGEEQLPHIEDSFRRHRMQFLVRASGPERDEEFVRYFHRNARCAMRDARREGALMRGGMGRAAAIRYRERRCPSIGALL